MIDSATCMQLQEAGDEQNTLRKTTITSFVNSVVPATGVATDACQSHVQAKQFV